MAAIGYGSGGDPNKVNDTGDSMTGPLVLPGDPVSALQAADKNYVDNQDATKITKGSDIDVYQSGLQRHLRVFNADGTKKIDVFHDGTWAQYVCDTGTVFTSLTTSTVATGASASNPQFRVQHLGGAYRSIDLNHDDTSGTISTTSGDLNVAPNSGQTNITGNATVTNRLTLGNDPVSTMQAATKQYADGKVAKAGDTMTGPLTTVGYVALSGTTALPVGAIGLDTAFGLARLVNRVAGDSQIQIVSSGTGDISFWVNGDEKVKINSVGELVILSGSTLKLGPVADTNLYRLGPNSMATDGKLTLFGGLAGNNAPGGNLTVQSTSNATKGKILIGTSAYDEVNNWLGVGNAAPTVPLDVTGAAKVSGTMTLGNDPTTAMQAATKQYVDNKTLTDVQTFTTSGTWTKPSWATATSEVIVTVIAGGGGGGSGRRTAPNIATAGMGGGGGAGGGMSVGNFLASQLSATEAVSVGTGGAGGAAQTVDTTSGLDGVSGNSTTFGGGKCRALGGTGGTRGQTTTGTGGTAGAGTSPGGAGANAAGTGGVGGNGLFGAGAAGGGAGGGIAATTNVAVAGGIGVAPAPNSFSTGGTAGPADGNGGSATTTADPTIPYPGASGGGGGSSITVAAGAGGNGVIYGGGGGGGGASVNGFNSGAGGSGAAGFARVVTRL